MWLRNKEQISITNYKVVTAFNFALHIPMVSTKTCYNLKPPKNHLQPPTT